VVIEDELVEGTFVLILDLHREQLNMCMLITILLVGETTLVCWWWRMANGITVVKDYERRLPLSNLDHLRSFQLLKCSNREMM
jgi:hypothetical protein